jgi:hypothetical protein
MLLLVSGTAKERLDQLTQGAGGRKEELPNQHASDPRNEHGTFADRRILREVTQLLARLASFLAAFEPPRQAAKPPSASGADPSQNSSDLPVPEKTAASDNHGHPSGLIHLRKCKPEFTPGRSCLD